MGSQPTLLLASGSPRREEILHGLKLTFTVQRVDVDEQKLAGETAEQMVLRLARAKAAAATTATEHLVIGADTAVVMGDEVLGKPRDEADAVAMLLRLSAKTHRVMTGVALRGPNGIQDALSCSTVTFREISRDEALAYWQSGEPRDKAGGYAIQGMGGVFIERLEGSYSGVVGLPVFETAELLRAAGVIVINKL
ncbi:MAG: septum formation inhibitor Maf [Gammaproteobacteria bacterium]|nr:septum formation inhibitor Maf [Gammaproteobacteria bacterium]